MYNMQDFMKMSPLSNVVRDFDFSKTVDAWNQGIKMFQNTGKNNQKNWGEDLANWQQDAMKNFNKNMKDWMEGCPMMMKSEDNGFESFKMNNFNSMMMKNFDMLSHFAEHVSENANGMLKKKADMLHKQSTHMFNLAKDMAKSSSAEAAIAMQVEHMKKGFEMMMQDSKEIYEMMAKTGMNTFEASSEKMHEAMHNLKKSCGVCDSHDHEKNSAKKNKKK